MNEFKYLFGPVPSRRFGRSLGIDLTPFKTCSYDCVFCQLGSTGKTTVDRAGFVDASVVKQELSNWAELGVPADCVTLSGSGEPTLHSKFDEVLEHAGKVTGLPTILLTNGSLLSLPEVRQAASKADMVKVSLSAWNDSALQKINRPHPSITFNKLFNGLKAFSGEYKGKLFIEVFLIEGVNTDEMALKFIGHLVSELNPYRIHLNTAVRPPAESFVKPVSPEKIERIARLFGSKASMINEFDGNISDKFTVSLEEISNILNRRPCTGQQLCQIFNMHPNELAKYLGKLVKSGQVNTVEKNSQLYYQSAFSQAL